MYIVNDMQITVFFCPPVTEVKAEHRFLRCPRHESASSGQGQSLCLDMVQTCAACAWCLASFMLMKPEQFRGCQLTNKIFKVVQNYWKVVSFSIQLHIGLRPTSIKPFRLRQS